MFKSNFIKLCNKKGVPPTVACRNIGLSAATFTTWSETSVPRRATLQKFADYFGVTVDDLLNEEYNGGEISVNSHNTVGGNATFTANIGGEVLGEFERELVNICRRLDVKKKNALLTRAYELLELMEV